MTSCWFCNVEERLRPHEREYDSAPYLNDDGTPQMVCQECYDDMRRYRIAHLEEVALSKMARLGALSTMTDRDYARWAEYEARNADAAEGFED
jgi:hypothetical protein